MTRLAAAEPDPMHIQGRTPLQSNGDDLAPAALHNLMEWDRQELVVFRPADQAMRDFHEGRPLA
jgi:hypothetical protein